MHYSYIYSSTKSFNSPISFVAPTAGSVNENSSLRTRFPRIILATLTLLTSTDNTNMRFRRSFLQCSYTTPRLLSRPESKISYYIPIEICSYCHGIFFSETIFDKNYDELDQSLSNQSKLTLTLSGLIIAIRFCLPKKMMCSISGR